MVARKVPVLFQQLFQRHSWRVWILWLVVGLVFWQFALFADPALLIYALDPEFVAAVTLFGLYYLRQEARRWPSQIASNVVVTVLLMTSLRHPGVKPAPDREVD